MRHPLIAAAALAAGLLAPALASAQTFEAVNNVSTLSMNVSIFNQADGLMVQPCTKDVVGTNARIVMNKSAGTCSGYDRIKIRISAFNVTNQPSCWYYDLPWNTEVTISGGDGGIQCTRTR